MSTLPLYFSILSYLPFIIGFPLPSLPSLPLPFLSFLPSPPLSKNVARLKRTIKGDMLIELAKETDIYYSYHNYYKYNESNIGGGTHFKNQTKELGLE